MARPRRMGAFNALDELLPGPQSETDQRRLEAISRPPSREREPVADEPRKGSGFNALDELLPGPLAARRRLQLVPDRSKGRGHGESKHLSAYNPLDALQPEEPPPKARVSLRLSAELLEAARDASAYLSHDHERLTLGTLAEEALRAELLRLAAEHNSGRPFPPRQDERKGRPTR